MDNIITALQLFGVGFTVGLSFQCFFVCAPLILTYVSAVEKDWRNSLWDLALLLGGRLIAYILLGALAGVSGTLLERFRRSGISNTVNQISAAILITLGASIALGAGFRIKPCADFAQRKGVKGISLAVVGFAIGVSPCLPLLTVMFQIILISKSALAGAVYALCFGLGTSLASFVIIGPAGAALGNFIPKLVRSETLRAAARIVCGVLIASFGIQFLRSSL